VIAFAEARRGGFADPLGVDSHHAVRLPYQPAHRRRRIGRAEMAIREEEASSRILIACEISR